MDKTRSLMMLLLLYIGCLIIIQWPSTLIKMRHLPQLVEYALKLREHPELNHYFTFTSFSISLFVNALRYLLIIFVMPIAFISLIRKKEWARRWILGGCAFLLLYTVWNFATAYPEAVLSMNSIRHLPPDLMEKVFGTKTFDMNYEFRWIQGILFTFLLFLLPIHFLNHPKITAQFR